MCHPFHEIIDGSGRSDRGGDTAPEQNSCSSPMHSRRGWLTTAATAVVAACAAIKGRSGLFAQETTLDGWGGASPRRPYGGRNPGSSGPRFYGGTFTTQALGEEGGGYNSPSSGPITTQALGEEGGGGNSPGGTMTTQALGEEGGSYPPSNGPITTQALGEEGGGAYPAPNQPTTLALGEEGGGSYYSPYRPNPSDRTPAYSPRYWRPFWRQNSR